MNLLDFFKTFKVDKTPEAITEMANMILSNKNLLSMIGQSSPDGWARTALTKLEEYNKYKKEGTLGKPYTTNKKSENYGKTNEQMSLDEAFRWITGSAQPTKKRAFVDRFTKTSKDLTSKIANELSNVANKLDFAPDMTPEEKANLTAQANVKQAKIDELMKSAQALGLETPKITRTESGWIPTSEVTKPGDRTMKEGEATVVKQDAQGNYDILSANNGRTIADNVSTDLSQALAIQTQRQAGGTPPLSGRPDLYAVQPTQQEMQPGYGQAFTPYQEQGQTITPQVATLDQINQLRNGTLESFNQANNIQSQQVVQPQPQPVFQPPVTLVDQSTTQNQVNTAVNTNVNNTTNQLVTATEQLVGQKEQAAAMQGVKVTADMRSAWLQEALVELKQNRYYQEVIRNTEFDLGTTLNRLVEDTRAREMNLAQQYKENLKGTQANLQNRGMLYGGVRQQAEKDLADQTNFGLQQLGQNMQRGLQDTSMQGERTLGSSYASGLVPKLGNTNLVGRVLAGSPVFQTGEKTNVFQFQGGNYGDLTRSLEEQARVRAGEKESTYRDTFSQYQ